jgi:hypothetical protein
MAEDPLRDPIPKGLPGEPIEALNQCIDRLRDRYRGIPGSPANTSNVRTTVWVASSSRSGPECQLRNDARSVQRVSK